MQTNHLTYFFIFFHFLLKNLQLFLTHFLFIILLQLIFFHELLSAIIFLKNTLLSKLIHKQILSLQKFNRLKHKIPNNSHLNKTLYLYMLIIFYIMQSKLSEDSYRYDWIISQIQNQKFNLQTCVRYCQSYLGIPQIRGNLIKRIKLISEFELSPQLSIIICIMCQNLEFEQLICSLPIRSISQHLVIRWSVEVFCENKYCKEIINNLESMTLKRFQDKNQISNQLCLVNNFYSKLFRIPKQLIGIGKSSEKLMMLMQNLQDDIKKNGGITCHSNLSELKENTKIVNIVTSQCRSFLSSQRVPFKITFEILSEKELHFDLEKNKIKRIQQEAILNNITYQNTKPKCLLLPHSYFGQQWYSQSKKIQSSSSFGYLSTYRICSYIVKSGDDIRQQYLAQRFIKLLDRCIKQNNLKIWVKPYKVIPFNIESGFIEFINNTQTISKLKELSGQKSLRNIYKQTFGMNWQTAINNFVQSLAGYSIVQYLLGVKDRHNNNILIDGQGHIIHIDFTFMLGCSPGGINFEQAPFKLTQDYLEIMEGKDSQIFHHFQFLLYTALKYISPFKDDFINIISSMKQCPNFKCLTNFNLKQVSDRFHAGSSDSQLKKIVRLLVQKSLTSYRTNTYDFYQWLTNDIHS